MELPPIPLLSNPLEYGPKLPIHRRPRFRRWVVVLIIFLAIASSARRVPVYWRFARVYYHQRECLAHPLPPGMLVFSSGVPAVSLRSPEFARLAADFTMGMCWTGGKPVTVYLGKRTASNGLTRFIAVEGESGTVAGQIGVGFLSWNRPIEFARPETQTQAVILGSAEWNSAHPWIAPAEGEALIHSAVEDPTDASHFSFAFDVDKWHWIMDCWLQPDGTLRVKQTDYEWHTTPAGARLLPFVALGTGDVRDTGSPY